VTSYAQLATVGWPAIGTFQRLCARNDGQVTGEL
jgi:hypothetical protein